VQGITPILVMNLCTLYELNQPQPAMSKLDVLRNVISAPNVGDMLADICFKMMQPNN
jgi:hypothetical protein